MAHPDAPIRAAAARIHALGAEVGVVAVAGGRVTGPALALILGHDVLPDPVNADGGVEQGGETVLVCRDERSRGGMKLRRVPPAVGREPPAFGLEVVAQLITPHPSRNAPEGRSEASLAT